MNWVDFDHKSKTAQGLLIYAIPAVAALLGHEMNADHASLMGETISDAFNLAGQLLVVLGIRSAVLRAK